MNNYVPPNELLTQNNSSNTGIFNQNYPQQVQPKKSEIENLRIALRSKSSYVTCPYCRHQGLTRVDGRCNVPDLLMCLATVGTLWGIWHFCRGKDLNCTNAEHYCMKCGNKLGKYSSC